LAFHWQTHLSLAICLIEPMCGVKKSTGGENYVKKPVYPDYLLSC
jgi:hypothetical protein